MSTVDVSVTASPDGAVPEAVPVFVIAPMSTSACVVVYVAVHVNVSPGASAVPGQLMFDSPGSGSVTATGSSVTLPAFSTTYVKVTSVFGASKSVTSADLLMLIACAGSAGMAASDPSATIGVSPGDRPVALASFVMNPASTSACVVVYVAVQVSVAPGATVSDGHETVDRPGNASLTVTACSVT